MSINYKKMGEMIEQEVNKMPDLSPQQKEKLSRISIKIYALESSVDAISAQKMIEEIKSEISLAASSFYGNGVK
jgi:hypothetical protein